MLKLRRDGTGSSGKGEEGGSESGGRAVRAWEEICVMCLGGMVQSEVAKGMSLCLFVHALVHNYE